jgi:hypothetical protein
MELLDFKKAWQKVNSDKSQREGMDVATINELLRRRSKGILSRLDRSVKFGIGFLVFFFLITLADQFLPANFIFPSDSRVSFEVPRWINLLEWFVNLILMMSILIFVVRYRSLQAKTLADQDLKETIEKVLELLDTFKKEFYLAVIILLSGISLGFLSGANKGFQSVQISQPSSILNVAIVVVAMLLLLGLILGSIFYIFHKGYNHLFGKYRDQLIKSLNELQENEE